MKAQISFVVSILPALILCSCSSALKLGGMKYRSAGSQYISGDLGQAVMIERAGQNHTIPLTKFKMGNVKFRGSSGKIFQKTTTNFGLSSELKGFSAGEVAAATATIGSGEDGKPIYSKTVEGSHVIFYPADFFEFMKQINSRENADVRKNLRGLQERTGRAMGVIVRVARVYGHESTKKIAGSIGLTGKYAGGDFVTTATFGRQKDIRLDDGSVSGYLVARLYWDKNDPSKISDLLELDYVGIDNPKFRWLNWFIR